MTHGVNQARSAGRLRKPSRVGISFAQGKLPRFCSFGQKDSKSAREGALRAVSAFTRPPIFILAGPVAATGTRTLCSGRQDARWRMETSMGVLCSTESHERWMLAPPSFPAGCSENAGFSVMSACSPPGPSVHGDSPGKKTGVGCHFLLQGIFLTQGSNLGLLRCRQILSCLSHKGRRIAALASVKKCNSSEDTSSLSLNSRHQAKCPGMLWMA